LKIKCETGVCKVQNQTLKVIISDSKNEKSDSYNANISFQKCKIILKREKYKKNCNDVNNTNLLNQLWHCLLHLNGVSDVRSII